MSMFCWIKLFFVIKQQFTAECRRQGYIKWDKRQAFMIRKFPAFSWWKCWWNNCPSLVSAWHSPLVALFLGAVCPCLWACSLGCQPTQCLLQGWWWGSQPGPDCLGPCSPCMGRDSWALGCWAVLVLPPFWLFDLCLHWLSTGNAKLSQTSSLSSWSSLGGK